MPKQKTHKGAQKRIKVTGKGKVKHHSAYGGHLMSSKDSARKRRISRPSVMNKTGAKKIKRLMGK